MVIRFYKHSALTAVVVGLNPAYDNILLIVNACPNRTLIVKSDIQTKKKQLLTVVLVLDTLNSEYFIKC